MWSSSCLLKLMLNSDFIRGPTPGLSPINVRKTAGDTGIEQLAELIAAEGVLQNLDVYECDDGEGKKKTTHAVSPAAAAGARCSC